MRRTALATAAVAVTALTVATLLLGQATALHVREGPAFRSAQLAEAPWAKADLALMRVYEHGGRKQPRALAQVSFAADFERNIVTGYDVATDTVQVERPAEAGVLSCVAFDETGRCLRASPYVVRGVPLRRLDVEVDVWALEDANVALPNVSAAGDVLLPDPTDQETVVTLAMMSLMAYENRNVSDDWVPVPGFNVTRDIGWDSDNLRGYVYANANASLVVLALKGTTLDFFGGSDTGAKDRIIDNIMFSCCCAYSDRFFGADPVCDCYSGICPITVTNETDVPFRSHGDDLVCCDSCTDTFAHNSSLSYYRFAQDIYKDVRATYPNASIWFTGHSLGGSLSSLLSQTYGHPAFGYNSVGEQRYAERLGLYSPQKAANGTAPYIFHFGNPGDVIMMGTCELCWLFGYAIETQCHVGHVCMYNNSARPSVNWHRLSVNLDRFLAVEPPPPCIYIENCTDCGAWQYI